MVGNEDDAASGRAADAPAAILVLFAAESPVREAAAEALPAADDRLHVVTAGDAAEALDVLGRRPVDAVVSDHPLPDRDGLAFLRTVRAEFGDLPFVLFTADGSERLASDAIGARATDYLPRDPASPDYATLAARLVSAVQRDRAARATAESRRMLVELAESTDDVLWMFDADFEEVYFMNSSYEEIWGRPLAALESDPLDFINGVHPDDRADVEEAVATLRAGEPTNLVYRVNPGEDYQRWVWVEGQPIFDADGEVVRVAGYAADITEYKQYEQTLVELHTAAQRLIDAEDREEVAAVTVRAACEILDLPISTLWFYDAATDTLQPAASSAGAETVFGELPTFREGDSLSYEAFEANEVRVFEDVSREPGRYNPETVVRSEIIVPLGDYGVINIGSTERGAFDDLDVSLAKILAANAEAAIENADQKETLRDERAFITQALNAMDDLFYVVDFAGTPLRWNDRLPEVTGYTDEEIAEMNALEFFAPEDREAVLEGIGTVEEQGRATVEAEVVTSEGERIPYELTGARLTDADGNHVGFVGIGRDITERRRREAELEAQNERLDEFASIVSHDLRNPLNVAQGRLELAREECESDHLAEVARAHDRMASLVDSLLTMAREGASPEEVEAVSLVDVAEAAWESVDTAAATLVVETDATIRANRSHLQQVLENLFRNSVEHGSPGRQPSADDSVEHDGSAVTVTVGDLGASGDTDESGFYVADDGPGFPAEMLDEGPDSGYTSRSRGVGLGMRIVSRLAEIYGWEVTLAESEPGGARVEIRTAPSNAAG